MKAITRRGGLVLLSVVLCSLAACDRSSRKTGTPIAPPSPPVAQTVCPTTGVRKTYIQTARRALLQKIGDQGYYQLTLDQVSPYATVTLDRPSRENGLVPVASLVADWDKGPHSFREDDPNAILVPTLIDGAMNKNGTFYLMTCSTPEFTLDGPKLSYVVKAPPTRGFIFDQLTFDGVIMIVN